MQNVRTLKFWDDYHDEHGNKEWIIQPTPKIFDMIFFTIMEACVGLDEKETNRLKILEIGCGTSSMARDLWKHIQQYKTKAESLHVRSTDVSHVCIDACSTRDKNIPNVFGPSHEVKPGWGLEYSILNMQEKPTESDCGKWDAILDKACLDTFLFRSRQRGESKTYSAVIVTALNNIWTLLADHGVYILLSPRTKLKAVRDFKGFLLVERRELPTEGTGLIVHKSPKAPQKKKPPDETCYMYICRKDPAYVVGVTKAFDEVYRDLPSDDAECPHCRLCFKSFRNDEDVEGRGTLFWTRQWKHHCIHCTAPHSSKFVSQTRSNS